MHPINLNLYGQRDFADLIKNLKIGRLPFVIFLGFPNCNQNCPHKKEAEEILLHKMKGNVMSSAEREV